MVKYTRCPSLSVIFSYWFDDEPFAKDIHDHFPVCDLVRNRRVYGVNANVHAVWKPTCSLWKADAFPAFISDWSIHRYAEIIVLPSLKTLISRQIPGFAISCVMCRALDESTCRRFLRVLVLVSTNNKLVLVSTVWNAILWRKKVIKFT